MYTQIMGTAVWIFLLDFGNKLMKYLNAQSPQQRWLECFRVTRESLCTVYSVEGECSQSDHYQNSPDNNTVEI